MGLFDSFSFDPSSYQSPSGSLIDRILAQLQTQGQFQPGAGFPNSPMDAQAAQAPQQGYQPGTAPTAVPPMQAPTPVAPAPQPYQMPRASAPVQDDETPVTATPTTGTLPRQTQAERQAGVLPGQLRPQDYMQPPSSGGGFGGALRGAVANMTGGPLGMIGGAIAGGLGMGQGTPLQQKQQEMMQNYRAFVAAGVPQDKAVLAAINPKAAESIVPAYLGADNLSVVQTGENDLGRKTYQVFNKRTGEFSPVPGNNAATENTGLGNMNLTGDAYLATVPKEQAGTIKAMVEGRLAPPSSFALSKPYWAKMIQAAQNYDPTFDATQWSGRVAGVKDFSAGKSSEMVRSANQTLAHVGSMLDDMDKLDSGDYLGNGNYPLLNRAKNAYSEATGSGVQGSFRANAHAVADEMAKVFKGNGISDAEIRAWENNLNENLSPEQQRAQVAKLRDLLHGSLSALEEKRVASIGPVAAAKAGPLIKDEGQAVLKRMDDWLAGNKASAAPQIDQSAVAAEMRRRGLLK